MAEFPTRDARGEAFVSARFQGDYRSIASSVAEWLALDPERERAIVEDTGYLPEIQDSGEAVRVVMRIPATSVLWKGYFVYLVKHLVSSLGPSVTLLGFWDEHKGARHSWGES